MQPGKLAKNSIQILLVILVVICLLEVALRVTGSFKTYSENRGAGFHTYYGETRDDWMLRWMPNDSFLLDYGVFKYGYLTNSWGYREREMRFSDSTDIRILAFGDSFTEGIGADSTETWPRYLENMLSGSLAPQKVEVLNFGHAGSDPFYYWKELEQHALELDPTLVLVAVGGSDFDDFNARGGAERFRDDGTTTYRQGPWFLGLYKSSRLARFIIHEMGGYEQETLIKRSKIDEKNHMAAEAIVGCLDDMNELCDKNDIEFIAFTFPHPYEVCHFKYEDMKIHLFESFETDFHLTELATNFYPLGARSDCTEFYWPSDGHFNWRGYEFFAAAVARKLTGDYPEVLE